MYYKIIDEIESRMRNTLTADQMEDLHIALVRSVTGSVLDRDAPDEDPIPAFLSAKRVEGCSDATLRLYRYILGKVLETIGKPIRSIATEDIRRYLAGYRDDRAVSKVTVDNVRRVLSSFFSWLENEDVIFKSPVRRIRKVRTPKVVKETYTDETLEVIRDNCSEIRDLAMVDLLTSTGMRVGELVHLNISDVDIESRSCVVFGKGDKERVVYFDARTKVHLSRYLESRDDSEEALFVSLLSPHKRLGIAGVETRLKSITVDLNVGRIYPHKFRRTMATRAIDRGMPVEQVQVLLGHSKIDTTMEYAMVMQTNVRESHRKYIS